MLNRKSTREKANSVVFGITYSSATFGAKVSKFVDSHEVGTFCERKTARFYPTNLVQRSRMCATTAFTMAVSGTDYSAQGTDFEMNFSAIARTCQVHLLVSLCHQLLTGQTGVRPDCYSPDVLFGRKEPHCQPSSTARKPSQIWLR